MDIVITFVLGFFISSYMSRKKIINFEKELRERFQEKEDMYLKLLHLNMQQSDYTSDKDINDAEASPELVDSDSPLLLDEAALSPSLVDDLLAQLTSLKSRKKDD